VPSANLCRTLAKSTRFGQANEPIGRDLGEYRSRAEWPGWLKANSSISDAIEIAYGLAQQFVTLLKERNAQPLSTWLRDCQMSGISDLVTFAQGLEKEGSALHAAFTLPYSNGPVEGNINKLKYIKRSMYGRGGFPLLRQRVLKAA
jgi:transposase